MHESLESFISTPEMSFLKKAWQSFLKVSRQILHHIFLIHLLLYIWSLSNFALFSSNLYIEVEVLKVQPSKASIIKRNIENSFQEVASFRHYHI